MRKTKPKGKPQLGNVCGRRECVAALRMLWPEQSITVQRIGELAGYPYWTTRRLAEQAGLPMRCPYQMHRVPAAAIRKAWMDRTVDAPTAAARVGLSSRTLAIRAKTLGLPPRKGKIHPKVIWPEDFTEMWQVNVLCKAIASACKRPPVSVASVTVEAKKRGLKMRGTGPNPKGLSLLQYRMMKDAVSVNAAAKAAWKEAA